MKRQYEESLPSFLPAAQAPRLSALGGVSKAGAPQELHSGGALGQSQPSAWISPFAAEQGMREDVLLRPPAKSPPSLPLSGSVPAPSIPFKAPGIPFKAGQSGKGVSAGVPPFPLGQAAPSGQALRPLLARSQQPPFPGKAPPNGSPMGIGAPPFPGLAGHSSGALSKGPPPSNGQPQDIEDILRKAAERTNDLMRQSQELTVRSTVTMHEDLMRQTQELQRELLRKQEEEARAAAEAAASEQKRQREEQMRKQFEERKKQMEEARRQQEERRQEEELRRKEEQERKNREAEEAAKLLHAELGTLADVAEAHLALAKEKLEPLESEKDTTDEKIIELAGAYELIAADVQAAFKSCNDFMAGKYMKLQGVQEPTKQAAAKLVKRVRDGKTDIDRCSMKAKAVKALAEQRKEKEARRVAAIKEEKRQHEIFESYDKDGDGRLSKDEILAFIKGEYAFEISEERLDAIIRTESLGGKDGVTYNLFPQLKLLIGIARDEFERKRKREAEEKRKALAAKQTAKVKSDAESTMQAIPGIEAEVQKAEQLARPLNVRMASPEYVEDKIDEVDAAVDAARDFLDAVRDQVAHFGGLDLESLEHESAMAARMETKKVSMGLDKLILRLDRVAGISKTLRDRIKLQQAKAALMKDLAAASAS